MTTESEFLQQAKVIFCILISQIRSEKAAEIARTQVIRNHLKNLRKNRR